MSLRGMGARADTKRQNFNSIFEEILISLKGKFWLHRGLYWTSTGRLLRVSSGRNFAEWVTNTQ